MFKKLSAIVIVPMMSRFTTASAVFLVINAKFPFKKLSATVIVQTMSRFTAASVVFGCHLLLYLQLLPGFISLTCVC